MSNEESFEAAKTQRRLIEEEVTRAALMKYDPGA